MMVFVFAFLQLAALIGSILLVIIGLFAFVEIVCGIRAYYQKINKEQDE